MFTRKASVGSLDALVVIDAKRRSTTGSTKGVRPQVTLFDESGEEVKIAGTEHSVAITDNGPLVLSRH